MSTVPMLQLLLTVSWLTTTGHETDASCYTKHWTKDTPLYLPKSYEGM